MVLVERSKIKKPSNCPKTTSVSIWVSLKLKSLKNLFLKKRTPLAIRIRSTFFSNLNYYKYSINFRSQNIALVRKLKEVEIEDDGLTTLDEAIEIFYRTLEEFLSHPALTLEFKRN